MDQNVLRVAEALQNISPSLGYVLRNYRDFVREYLVIKGYSDETRENIKKPTIHVAYNLYKDMTVDEIRMLCKEFAFALVSITPTGLNVIYIPSWDRYSSAYNPEYHKNPEGYLKAHHEDEDE